MLPDGSAFVRVTKPARAWDQSQHNSADLMDTLWEIAWWRAGQDATKAPHIRRPAQIEAAKQKKKQAKQTKKTIENTKWEEV